MKIRVYADERGVARYVAGRVAALVREEPAAVLGLPTGRTPIQLYRELVVLHGLGRLALNRVTTFNLDEFVGLSADHPGSYRAFMDTHLFMHVAFDRRRTHLLNGMAPSAEAECARYESAIDRAGGVDLMLLGIGANGHIGFNEPAPALEARTHRVRLRPESRRSNASLFGDDPAQVPPEALTMGIGTILDSRAIVLMATGHSKSRIVARAVTGPITTRVPASFLQLHADVEIVLDESAAGELRRMGRLSSGR